MSIDNKSLDLEAIRCEHECAMDVNGEDVQPMICGLCGEACEIIASSEIRRLRAQGASEQAKLEPHGNPGYPERPERAIEVLQKWGPHLREVAHAAFHLCDDSEEDAEAGFIRVDTKQWKDLCEALGALGSDETHEALEQFDSEVAQALAPPSPPAGPALTPKEAIPAVYRGLKAIHSMAMKNLSVDRETNHKPMLSIENKAIDLLEFLERCDIVKAIKAEAAQPGKDGTK